VSFDTSHLDGKAKEVADAIVEHIRTTNGREPWSGGCKAFYLKEDWEARPEPYGDGSMLVLVHDGGDLAPFCDYGHGQYDLIESMNAMLEKHGVWFECLTNWSSAIYEIAPTVARGVIQ